MFSGFPQCAPGDSRSERSTTYDQVLIVKAPKILAKKIHVFPEREREKKKEREGKRERDQILSVCHRVFGVACGTLPSNRRVESQERGLSTSRKRQDSGGGFRSRS